MNAAARQTESPRRRRLGQHSAAELLDMQLPAIRYIVPGYFAEGLTLFAGRSKIGKSWFLLGTAIAIATGGVALGSIPVEQGDVLVLALEDNARRMQKRLSQLLPTGAKPGRITIDYECPRLDQGLLLDLEAWIKSVIRPRMIIIDTLGRVRPATRPNEPIYDWDVRTLAGLQALSAQYGLAIVVCHHVRKAEAEDPFDCLSGSTGLPATADTTLVLSRDSQGITLYGRGRDIEEVETAMLFDRQTGHWSVIGAVIDVRRSNERTRILDILESSAELMSPSEIAGALGQNANSIRQLLFKMVKAGEILKAKGKGKYAHPDYAGLIPPQ